jgi:TIR domain
VIVSPHNLEMVEREREPSRGPPHPEAASISRLDLGGRRWRRRAMWLAGALAITVGQGYALRHEFGALFDWVAGALWHGATLPAPSARPDTDVVDVIAFAPPSTSKGERFLVQVFLGKTAEDEDVTRVAALASDPTTSKRLVATLDVELAYGDRIDIKLEAANLSVEEPEQSLIWRGKPRSVAFVVRVSEDFMGDRAFVQVRVYRQAIPIGKIAFSILTEGHFGDISPVGELSRAYRRAFLSYASPDRPEVIKRAQALKAGKIDFFMDLLSLEPGERWEKRLYSEIDRCDLFVLFWSNEARNSPWVDREIRYALNCIKKHVSRNEARPEIYPIIIEGPPPPLPPDSLSHLQFNDPYLYLIASMEKLTSARPAN